jgi:ABC-type transporter Mla subunit MlaD
MADEHRLSRKAQEKKKGWIGIVVWILAAALLFAIVLVAKNIGQIPGTRHYVYFEESVAGLLKNSKVKYRGVEAGRVVNIELTLYPVVMVEEGDGQPVPRRSDVPVSSPVVEVELAIQNPDAKINDNARAYLRSNPLSGMQQIDIQDLSSRRGAELKRNRQTEKYETKLFAGGVDLSAWVRVTVTSYAGSSLASMHFHRETPTSPVLVDLVIDIPYEFWKLDPTEHLVQVRQDVSKGIAFVEIVRSQDAPPDAYALRPGPRQGTLLVTMPALAIGVDPVLSGSYALAGGGPPTGGAMISDLIQGEEEGVTGRKVKYLHVKLEGGVEPPAGSPTDKRLQRWLTLDRHFTRGGARFLEVEMLFEGNPLPPGAPIEVAQSPLNMLLERADTIAATIDYLPTIARNVEQTSANIVAITTELKDRGVTQVMQAVEHLDENLARSITELKITISDKVKELSTTLNTEVRALSSKAQGKLDEAMPAETMEDLRVTIAGFRDSIEDWRKGLAAARGTFEQAKDIVGFKGEGKTVAETVNTLHAAVANLDKTLQNNEARLSTTLDALKETLKSIEKVLEELRPQ